MDSLKFSSKLDRFNSELWHFHISVPKHIVSHYKEKGVKRFICKLNNKEQFHCAMMPAGSGEYFINLNKSLRENLNVQIGDTLQCEIWEDVSKYGMPMPEELEAVLNTDYKGSSFFEALTPGKQRSLIYIIAKMKNTDKRIEKALIILNHLTTNQGNLDFKALNHAFKLGL